MALSAFSGQAQSTNLIGNEPANQEDSLSYVNYEKAGLKVLLSYAINTDSGKFAPETRTSFKNGCCVHLGPGSFSVGKCLNVADIPSWKTPPETPDRRARCYMGLSSIPNRRVWCILDLGTSA